MSDSIVGGEFVELTPQDMGQASGTCEGRKLMKLFLRNPSFDCRYQIGLNLFSWVVQIRTAVHACCVRVDRHCFARSGYAYRALADVASFTRYEKSLHPGFVVPTIPSYADQILNFSNV